MYNSPIDTIVTQIQMQHKAQLENDIFQAVQNIGVNVDKDELLKALQYDRGQYVKGYGDGYKVAIEKFAEKLKERTGTDFPFVGSVFVADIDNLAKEMTEVEQ